MFHTYNDVGLYSCNITAYNLVSNETAFEMIFAQIPIVNFTIHDIPPITYGQDNISIPMSVDQGSNMTVFVTFDDIPVETAYIDNLTLNGYAIIRDTYYSESGYFNVTGNVSNLVTPNISFTLGVWIDYPIINPVITIDKYVTAINESITVMLNMDRCSRVNVTFEFDDGSPDYLNYTDLLSTNDTITSNHTYNISGYFDIQTTIQNPVDLYSTNVTVIVQEPVVNLTLFPEASFATVGVPFLLQWNISLGKAESRSMKRKCTPRMRFFRQLQYKSYCFLLVFCCCCFLYEWCSISFQTKKTMINIKAVQ